METGDDEGAVRESAAQLYADGQVIWHDDDAWNTHKRDCIDRFCAKKLAGAHYRRSLDIGAGRHPYAWMPKDTFHTDRFHEQVRHHSRAVAAEAEALPFVSSYFDLVVCVGAVLNYVSAIECLAEIARVTRRGGHLLLHFETSTSAEHIGSRRWGASAVRLSTINASRPDNIWIYRPGFIYDQLRGLGFRILNRSSFHIASAVGLKLGLSQARAARWARFDRIVRMGDLLADDIILLAERI